jgi:hypothetical protein
MNCEKNRRSRLLTVPFLAAAVVTLGAASGVPIPPHPRLAQDVASGHSAGIARVGSRTSISQVMLEDDSPEHRRRAGSATAAEPRSENGQLPGI